MKKYPFSARSVKIDKTKRSRGRFLLPLLKRDALKIDEIDDYSEEAVSAVWNAYQSGEYEDAPKAVSCQSTSYELLEALDNAGSWDEDFVEETARELCERAGVNFDTYEDYDTLFDALKRAILG